MSRPAPLLAVVTVHYPGFCQTALHSDPLLVALAEAWQKEAVNTPLPGSMAAWFQDNRRRFQPAR